MAATASTSGKKKGSTASEGGFSEQERAAIKKRAAELRTEARRGSTADKAAADEADVLAKIAEMPESDRVMAERVHAIVTTVAPDLDPKLYYGQPGYGRKGKVLCFFRSGQMDKERYSTFGFSVQANLDAAAGLWPTSYALIAPTERAWDELGELVKQAAS
ncbi:Domain of unknown function DUF1801 [Beutenbergia cavernae DSM 12333]|uniref:YdhG-like domain-containing protein n=1 Tax=Beutenbergia cavernae (strain ATCC BAA-8 / DSM 12333 / CCUG 43141 / JCM 11478 / NBRC 16432 / NCIMB 13614 / HKI 0122) TaxID=471853 RepID=C5C5Y1_BEUC1|nr:DUF1801 domain-containing protein [Beutenbergia cavernae]ACQ82339.1 Domain of unknown function DUF1801 [Beutenbergia cavernae DSM 12333]